MDGFKLLSYYEEDSLSLEERVVYYQALKEYLKNLPMSASKKLYLDFCQAMNKKIVRGLLDKIKGYDLVVENQDLIPDQPVIFATTHQEFHDHFNVVLSIPYHAIILNNVNVSKAVKIAMGVNGIEYVDRNNPASRYTSKVELMEYVAKGKSVVVFPEGTFNCSPNKLVLPFHSGVLDISRKMQVPIVPLVQEYFYKDAEHSSDGKIEKCVVRFGKPITVSYDDKISDKKEELKEAFSTLRYEIYEGRGVHTRSEITEDEYVNTLISKLKTFESVKSSYEEEAASIYGANDYFYNLFPINAVGVEEANEKMK